MTIAQINPDGSVIRYVPVGTPLPPDWSERPVIDVGADLAPGTDERLIGPVVTVNAETVERVWTIEPIPPAEIAAALQQQVADAVQRHLDAAVRTRGYDSMATCVTYAGEASVPRFQAEGRAARAWRSAVWDRCYAVLAEVLAGERAPLTPDEMIAELPPLVWPD